MIKKQMIKVTNKTVPFERGTQRIHRHTDAPFAFRTAKCVDLSIDLSLNSLLRICSRDEEESMRKGMGEQEGEAEVERCRHCANLLDVHFDTLNN